MKDDGGPAFPRGNSDSHFTPQGMSLRDYFAAAAMGGMFANSALTGSACGTPTERAEAAYIAADAMLKERLK